MAGVVGVVGAVGGVGVVGTGWAQDASTRDSPTKQLINSHAIPFFISPPLAYFIIDAVLLYLRPEGHGPFWPLCRRAFPSPRCGRT